MGARQPHRPHRVEPEPHSPAQHGGPTGLGLDFQGLFLSLSLGDSSHFREKRFLFCKGLRSAAIWDESCRKNLHGQPHLCGLAGDRDADLGEWVYCPPAWGQW